MKRTILTITLLSILIAACGPSKEQIAAEEKRKLDSVAAAAKQELINQQANAQIVADSLAAVEAAKEQTASDEAANREALEQQLIELKGELAGEEAKMNSIQQFQLGRMASEKAQQIADQTRVIEELKYQISETEKQINN